MLKKNLLVILTFSIFVIITPNRKIDASQTVSPRQNEILAMGAIAKMYHAQIQYRDTLGNGRYGGFSELHDAGLIDPALAVGEKFGYYFWMKWEDPYDDIYPPRFTISAAAKRYGKTGRRFLRIDSACNITDKDLGRAATSQTEFPITSTCPRLIQNDYESEVKTILTSIYNAQMTYKNTGGKGDFAGSLTQLFEANLIKESLADGTTAFYDFQLAASEDFQKFEVKTKPTSYPYSGFRSFYLDETAVLRGADKKGEFGDEDDPPIEIED